MHAGVKEMTNKRQIEFRGMTLRGDWVIGYISVLKNKMEKHISTGIYISNSFGSPFAYAVRPETVGQFTGLLDKTGNKIFEDDIVRYYESNGEEPEIDIGIVEWYAEGASFVYLWPESGYQSMDECEIEVIGNIFENKELLV
jgi:uncharacterized phage protein (TIGR01671 family)